MGCANSKKDDEPILEGAGTVGGTAGNEAAKSEAVTKPEDVKPGIGDVSINSQHYQSSVDLLPLPRTKDMGFVHMEESLWKLEQFYDLGDRTCIGKGGNGSVSIIKKRSSGDTYALKTISNRLIKNPEMKQELLREIEVQKALDHPNIVKLYESFEDPKHGEMYIVMELCTGGDLVSRLRQPNNRHGMGEVGAATLMEEMLSAVLYCHSHGVVHRDIKLDNFMFEDPSPDAEVKLIDFGFACEVAPGHEKMWDKLGTPSYMAPELWDSERPGGRSLKHSYNSSVDIWALGVTVYLLLSGQRPWFHPDVQERARMICNDPVPFSEKEWGRISAEAKDFVLRLLNKDADKRIGAQDALEHPWIKQKSKMQSGAHDSAEDMKAHDEVVASLQAFAQKSELHKVALEVIAFSTPPAKMTQLRQMFHHMDEDHAGVITIEQFRHAMSQHPEIPLAQVDNMFAAMDQTHTGLVDYTEFLAAAISSQQNMDTPSVNTIFGLLDRDGDGFVTAADLIEVLGIDDGNEFQVHEIEEMLKLGVGAAKHGEAEEQEKSAGSGLRRHSHHHHADGIKLTITDFKYMLLQRTTRDSYPAQRGSEKNSSSTDKSIARLDQFIDKINSKASTLHGAPAPGQW